MKTLVRNGLLSVTALLLVGQTGRAGAGQELFKIYTPGVRATTSAPAAPPVYAMLNPGDKGSTITLSSGNLAMSGNTGDDGARYRRT
jgi:hypothetical protein